MVYCLKYGCAISGVGATYLAAGISQDLFLEQTKRNPVFITNLARGFNLVSGLDPNQIQPLIDKIDLTSVQVVKRKL
jgi:hypothetical protein